MRRLGHAGKVDINQPSLVRDLRKFPGVTVWITSSVGHGFPDLLVGFRGRNWLFEVKPEGPPSRQHLSLEEVEWHFKWRGQVQLITTLTEALLAIGVDTASIRTFLFAIGHKEAKGQA